MSHVIFFEVSLS